MEVTAVMESNLNIVDFHAHVLPGADHGSDSLETSLRQLKSAKDAGVTRIIATPHFYPHSDSASKFIARRKKAFDTLSEHLTDELPSVKMGAEVLLCDNLDKLPELPLLCIENTNVLLLELPFSGVSNSHVSTVENIIDNGIDVVLAHADRYKPEIIERFIDIGAKIQLNANSLSKFFIPQHIKHWILENLVMAIGSDIHGADDKIYKMFKKAVAKFGEKIETVKKFSYKIWI